MTPPYLLLDNVGYTLPDGRILFSDLSLSLDSARTGLVGRNGVGKSMLARIMAGELIPSHGRCQRLGSVRYLPQHIPINDSTTIASLLGIEDALTALQHIEAGSTDSLHFDVLADRWDVRQQLQQALDNTGLGHLNAHTPAQQLSGGECMRLALAGALLSNVDLLILDEPTNHLDSRSRAALQQQLQQWPNGLLLISHDRALLSTVEHIIELTPTSIQSYGGNYQFYVEQKAIAHAAATQALEHLQHTQKQEHKRLQMLQERQTKRQAQGTKHGKEANQAKILLDRQKERSESSAGRIHQQQAARLQQLGQQLQQAQQQLTQESITAIHAVHGAPPTQQRAVVLEEIVLPHGDQALRSITFTLYGRQRVAVHGPNGCGKSTLLKVIAGHVEPLSGARQVNVPFAYLDQHLHTLDPQRTVLEQLRDAAPKTAEGNLRTRLVHLGLDSQRILLPTAQLSGGERIKAALACLLYADEPPHLLLLDEPSNHLDLPALHALEHMLRHYQGSLMVVSHDSHFLNQLALTHALNATAIGWQLEELPPTQTDNLL